MSRDTTSQEFFDEKYRKDPDPWRFRSSEYEQGRYEATVRALEGCCYKRAFEPGCSIGLLTARLARFCGQIEAMDISPAAIAQARTNCSSVNVRFTVGALPGAMPDGMFDLMVLSEIGYYFDEPQWTRLSADLVKRVQTPGTLVATHWLGRSEDHKLSGDRVHEVLGIVGGLTLTHAERVEPGNGSEGYRLDRWDRI